MRAHATGHHPFAATTMGSLPGPGWDSPGPSLRDLAAKQVSERRSPRGALARAAVGAARADPATPPPPLLLLPPPQDQATGAEYNPFAARRHGPDELTPRTPRTSIDIARDKAERPTSYDAVVEEVKAAVDQDWWSRLPSAHLQDADEDETPRSWRYGPYSPQHAISGGFHYRSFGSAAQDPAAVAAEVADAAVLFADAAGVVHPAEQ